MNYDQKQLIALFERAKKVLGPQASRTLRSKPRGSAFSTAISRTLRAVGNPENVTDEQILSAYQIAHNVFPVELEVLSPLFSEPTQPLQMR